MFLFSVKEFHDFLKVWIRFSKFYCFQRQTRASKPYFNDPEAQVASVEHDDLVLVGAVVHDMPQSEQRGRVGEHCTPPRRVPFVGDDEVLLVGYNGFVEHSGVIIFIRRSEMVLYTEIKIDLYF